MGFVCKTVLVVFFILEMIDSTSLKFKPNIFHPPPTPPHFKKPNFIIMLMDDVSLIKDPHQISNLCFNKINSSNDLNFSKLFKNFKLLTSANHPYQIPDGLG